jgi:hypothetical protein
MSIVAEGTQLAGELDATYPPVLSDWLAKSETELCIRCVSDL